MGNHIDPSRTPDISIQNQPVRELDPSAALARARAPVGSKEIEAAFREFWGQGETAQRYLDAAGIQQA